jgi:putative transposase
LNGELFKEFVKEDLLPNLWSGAGVVMDNLTSHKVEGVKSMIEGVGAQVIYLSSYSCEFNPIEHLWWEIKAFVRRFSPKDEDAVKKLVELQQFSLWQKPYAESKNRLSSYRNETP